MDIDVGLQGGQVGLTPIVGDPKKPWILTLAFKVDK